MIIHARDQVSKFFNVPCNPCYYEELEPVEIQNAQTSTAFLKEGKYLEKQKFLVNITVCFLQNLKHVLQTCSPKD